MTHLCCFLLLDLASTARAMSFTEVKWGEEGAWTITRTESMSETHVTVSACASTGRLIIILHAGRSSPHIASRVHWSKTGRL
jgi:hypothetical protein